LTAASLIENSTVGSCNGTADASNGTAGEGSNNINATDSSADNNNDAGSNSTNTDTGNDAKNNGTSEEGSDGKDTGSSQGKGSGASSSQKVIHRTSKYMFLTSCSTVRRRVVDIERKIHHLRLVTGN
jgi:hypothetical protein